VDRRDTAVRPRVGWSGHLLPTGAVPLVDDPGGGVGQQPTAVLAPGREHAAAGDELGALLGLSPVAQRVVTGWAVAAQGRALWLVGDRAFKVQTVLTEPEMRLTDTNDALIAGRPA
jgi:hypothetical protein